MRGKTIETMRFVLTITGLTLLIVFGARAAGQAQDMKLAGATSHHRSIANFSIGRLTELNPLFAGVPNAINLASPLRVAAHTTPVAPKEKEVSSSQVQTSTSTDTVAQVKSFVSQSVQPTKANLKLEHEQMVQQHVESNAGKGKATNTNDSQTTVNISDTPASQPAQ